MAVGITLQLQLRTYIRTYTSTWIKSLAYVKDLVLVNGASVEENFLTNQSFLAFMIVQVV